jgi:multiple sugar transport system substrate-binding protein
VNKLAHFLLGTAMMAVPSTLHAEEPDLSQLQQSLQAEQKHIEALGKLAEQAAANQQELKSLQQENQQLTAAVAQLHEQIQLAEGRAANAEAERDQLRTELANVRQQAAAETEGARQSLAALVTRIKELNDAAGQQASAARTPEPVLVEAPKPPLKHQVLARKAATATAPKPVEPVLTAAIESENVDERAVLGGPDPGGVLVMTQMVGVVLLAVAQGLAPLGARAANLVMWWNKGYYAQEGAAVREVIAAIEQKTGKQIELTPHPMEELPDDILATIESGRPPDFAFGLWLDIYAKQWAYEGRLVDLSDAIGHFSDLFDPAQLDRAVLLNGTTGGKALCGLPVSQITHFTHVWKSLLKQAGFTLEHIPREWDSYWSFWCDQVQPAVRRASGHDDTWVSASICRARPGTRRQFMTAYEADYENRDGRLVIDDPGTWNSNRDNNRAFLAERWSQFLNDTLSIPNTLRRERPEDYHKNTVTIQWPLSPDRAALPILGSSDAAVVFRDGYNVEIANEFVHFLVAEGWLAHYLDFAGERFLPAMQKLREGPLWLDPSDPHRMAAVMQIASRPMQYEYIVASGDWRYDLILQELVWGNAVHRVVTEGISPEQAVDEAIARIKQILSE